MKCEDLCAIDLEAPGQRIDNRRNTARLTNHQAPTGDEPRKLPQGLSLANLGHCLRTSGPTTKITETSDRVDPKDSIWSEPLIALKVTQSRLGGRTEDPIDPAGIEAKGTELLLELHHVVAA